MKKALILAIIAIILVISVVGVCVALYKVAATQKQVNITASSGSTCNLTIGTADNLNFTGISPNSTTRTFDITLSTSNNALADGVSGIFKVTKGGAQPTYVDVTVNEIPSIGGALGSEVAAATTVSGATIALSALPKYYRVTITLNATGIAAFDETLAETQFATVSASWEVDEDSLFTYDANAYYVVGTINGVTAWSPTANSIVLDSATTGTNRAQKDAVTLHNGDTFKVVKNYRVSPEWPATQASNSSVEGVTVAENGANIQITADGTYYIFVNDNGQVWVDTHA